jgi:alpha-1,2-mannosyltransferase
LGGLADGIGFHATTEKEFADSFAQALTVPNPLHMRLLARASAKRFTEKAFAEGWICQMEALVTRVVE